MDFGTFYEGTLKIDFHFRDLSSPISDVKKRGFMFSFGLVVRLDKGVGNKQYRYLEAYVYYTMPLRFSKPKNNSLVLTPPPHSHLFLR